MNEEEIFETLQEKADCEQAIDLLLDKVENDILIDELLDEIILTQEK